MNDSHSSGPIYACIAISPDREVQVGPVPSWEEALAVEEVMRERISELLAAEDLIREVDGEIVGAERWDALHDETLQRGLERFSERLRAH